MENCYLPVDELFGHRAAAEIPKSFPNVVGGQRAWVHFWIPNVI